MAAFSAQNAVFATVLLVAGFSGGRCAIISRESMLLARRSQLMIEGGSDSPVAVLQVHMAHINFFQVRGEESMTSLVAMAEAPRGDFTFLQTATQSRLARSSPHMAIHDHGGNFGGLQFFTEALLKDLPGDTINRIDRCNLHGHGGNTRGSPQGDPLALIAQGHPKVWIVVNGEDYSGEYYYKRWLSSLVRAGHQVLLIGNKWNSSLADFSGTGFTSLWAPFASLHFAERQRFTPMDLVHLPSASLNGVRDGTIAYQSRVCQPDRERLFDDVEKELFAATGQHASALGECHGQGTSSLARTLNFELPSDPLSHFDESVERYQKFKFAMNMEHNENNIGYVTEKLVDGLLAGSVPIYAGDFAAAAEMFDMRGVVRADLSSAAGSVATAKEVVRLAQDPEAYEHYRKHEPLVLEQALRKQFSWHPAVWPTHGDELRMRIVDEILRACEHP